MASKSKTRINQSKQAETPRITLADGELSDARAAIENAIDALYRIWRLSDKAGHELDECNVDGHILLDHVATLCFRHGKALDALYARLSPGERLGCFDECGDDLAALAAFESPIALIVGREGKEAANG